MSIQLQGLRQLLEDDCDWTRIAPTVFANRSLDQALTLLLHDPHAWACIASLARSQMTQSKDAANLATVAAAPLIEHWQARLRVYSLSHLCADVVSQVWVTVATSREAVSCAETVRRAVCDLRRENNHRRQERPVAHNLAPPQPTETAEATLLGLLATAAEVIPDEAHLLAEWWNLGGGEFGRVTTATLTLAQRRRCSPRTIRRKVAIAAKRIAAVA